MYVEKNTIVLKGPYFFHSSHHDFGLRIYVFRKTPYMIFDFNQIDSSKKTYKYENNNHNRSEFSLNLFP